MGFGGSGPAQTALAILADALKDDEKAVLLHQEFKRRMISCIGTDMWSMTMADVLAAVKEIES